MIVAATRTARPAAGTGSDEHFGDVWNSVPSENSGRYRPRPGREARFRPKRPIGSTIR